LVAHSAKHNQTVGVLSLTMTGLLQACKYVPGAELLQMDPTDACDKLRMTLKVLGSFKSQYFTYKAASAVECPSNPWRFQNSLIFGRLDKFMERCY